MANLAVKEIREGWEKSFLRAADVARVRTGTLKFSYQLETNSAGDRKVVHYSTSRWNIPVFEQLERDLGDDNTYGD